MDIPRLSRWPIFVVLGALSALVFYRPSSMIVVPALDDTFYVSQVQDIIGEEAMVPPRLGMVIGSFVAPGTAWAWTPVALGAKWIAHARAEDETEWLWAVLSFFGYVAWVACLPLTLILFETFPGFAALHDHIRLILGTFLFLNLPLLSNAVGHNLSPHIFEVFWSLLMMIFLRTDKFIPALLACGMLVATRYNDAPALLMLLVHPITRTRADFARIKKNRWKLAGAAVFALAVFWKALVVAFARGYGGTRLQDMLHGFEWSNVRNFFIHWGHGVAYTYPLWLVAFVLALWGWKRLSSDARAGWVWMLLHIGLYSIWGGPGASMGHRYLCGTYGAVFLILGELWFAKPIKTPYRLGALLTGLGGAGAWLSFLMLTFCSCQQLNYSVDFEIAGRPGVIFHPFYFDRLFHVIGNPMLYEHVLDLGLFRSVQLSMAHEAVGNYGEAILPPNSIALHAAQDVFVLCIFALSVSCFALFPSKRHSP